MMQLQIMIPVNTTSYSEYQLIKASLCPLEALLGKMKRLPFQVCVNFLLLARSLLQAKALTPPCADNHKAERHFRAWKVPMCTVFLGASIVIPVLAFDPSIYTNNYDDPFHPLCKRRIEVSRDRSSLRYSGTTVGSKDDPLRRGCSSAEIREFGLRKEASDGKILRNGRISVGSREGIWEPANTATTNLGFEGVDGIRWNDGSKWTTKKNGVEGPFGYFFLTYIAVSTLAGLAEFSKRLSRASSSSGKDK